VTGFLKHVAVTAGPPFELASERLTWAKPAIGKAGHEARRWRRLGTNYLGKISSLLQAQTNGGCGNAMRPNPTITSYSCVTPAIVEFKFIGATGLVTQAQAAQLDKFGRG